MRIQVRPDLDAEREKASIKKVSFRMDPTLRTHLLDVLLDIQNLAGDIFDMLDADQVSEADILLMLQLPDYCNKFTKAMETHARQVVRPTQGDVRNRQRTSYMSLHSQR